MDISKYKKLYIYETTDHLSGIEQGLLSLEAAPGDPSTIDNLFRHYHSIKGMSASMGYRPLMELAHAQEDLLSGLRSGAGSVTVPMLSVLLEGLDIMKDMLEKVEKDEPLDTDTGPFIKKVEDVKKGGPPPAREDASKGGGEDGHRDAEENKTPSERHTLRLPRIMKVESSVFDELLTVVGDLFMVLTSLKGLSQASRSIDLKDAVHILGREINTLYEKILSARMLPVDDLATGLPRIVRDVAARSGKDVEFRVEGGEITLDRAILSAVGDPLVHIIRNAVDHGIEEPDERVRAGKPPKGTILLRAYGRRDRIVIEVSDDGRGIDISRLREKAVERGMSAGEVAELSDKEALMLMCMPGLSLARRVTETSGRGVGMDVVKDNIERLGGTLDIESVFGKGAKIILSLPRTTSITRALFVSVGEERFLIPVSRIEKVLDVEKKSVENGVLKYEDNTAPVMSLASIFDMAPVNGRERVSVLIVEGASGPLGLVVDDFGDEVEAYVKPLRPPLSKLRGVSGIAVTGDGRPVFLIDVDQIISGAVL